MSEDNKLQMALMELGELDSTNILEIKEFLKNWTPRTASEAILAMNFVHVVTSNAKHIRDSCAGILNTCKYCDGERVDSDTGLKVLRSEKPSRKVYNETEELTELYAQMEELNKKIQEAKERAGYTTQQEEGYNYKVKF